MTRISSTFIRVPAAWVALLLLLVLGAVARAQVPEGGSPVLQKLLNDRELLTDNGMAAIRAAAAWRDAGQRQIVVFAELVMAAEPIDDAVDADKAATDAQASMRQRPAAEAAQTAQFNVVATRLPDDGRLRLAWRSPGATFLKPGVPMSAIEERYGKPQQVSTRLIEGEGERRPTVLTLYEYDGGAVSFAASDMSPMPGTVDRIFIDVSAIAAN